MVLRWIDQYGRQKPLTEDEMKIEIAHSRIKDADNPEFDDSTIKATLKSLNLEQGNEKKPSDYIKE